MVVRAYAIHTINLNQGSHLKLFMFHAVTKVTIYIPATALLLVVFTYLLKATVSFVESVCPSVHMEQLRSLWVDFHKFDIYVLF
jgi:hypothetical protein